MKSNDGGARPRRRWGATTAALIAVVCSSTNALAHHTTAEEVMARLSAAEVRQPYDITEVDRSAALPRLLLIRVGRGWTQVDAVRRVGAAEQWYQLWRDAVPNGILGIVDASDRPLVNFDAAGRARLYDPAAARPTSGAPTP